MVYAEVSMRAWLIDFAAFQLGWFACVGGAAAGLAWPGPLAALVYAVWRLAARETHLERVRLMLAFGALGTLLDSVWAATGTVVYATADLFGPSVAPPWIIALWLMFGLTVDISLRWMRHRPALAGLASAVFGPLGYLGAARIGAAELTEPTLIGLVALGASWGICIPLVLKACGPPRGADSAGVA